MKTAQPVRADGRVVLARALCSWSGSDRQAIEIPNHVRRGRFFDARERMGGALRRRPPQRSEDEKSITASAVITPHPAKPNQTR